MASVTRGIAAAPWLMPIRWACRMCWPRSTNIARNWAIIGRRRRCWSAWPRAGTGSTTRRPRLRPVDGFVTFELIRLRFLFRAAGSLFFPPGKAGNVLRGAFGVLLRDTAGGTEFARIFRPKGGGPSGLADAPRPFVFRAAHLDGRAISPGAPFQFDAHLFGTRADAQSQFIAAFAHWGERAELISVERREFAIDFSGPPAPARRVRVAFVTPTELKPAASPEFPVLFARLRDRISTLRALYGPGALDI